ETRRPHRDRVRAAVLGAADRDSAVRHRLEKFRHLLGAQMWEVSAEKREGGRRHELSGRFGESLVPGQALVSPGAVAVELVAAHDVDVRDTGLLDGRDDVLQ